MKGSWSEQTSSSLAAGVLVAIIGAIGTKIYTLIKDIDSIKTSSAIVITSIFVLISFFVGRAVTRRALLDQKIKDISYDKIYLPNESVGFYAEIADSYDVRNSQELLNTHRKVVEQIKIARFNKKSTVVIDIGGGTGKSIAEHFFADSNYKWIYVDACGKMAHQFRNNLKGVSLKTECHVMTISEAFEELGPNSCDVLLFSFILSSIDGLPDFSKALRLLKPDGIMIIAEADPSYSGANPYYGFKLEFKEIALHIQAIHNLELQSACENSGFKLVGSFPTHKKGLIYSYISVFKPTNEATCETQTLA